MIRDLSALAKDLAGYTSGVLRARAAYAETGYKRCKRCGVLKAIGERCPKCKKADDARRWRERKGAS